MSTDDRLHDFILSVYDAGLGRVPWIDVAGGLVELLGMHGATILLEANDRQAIVSSAMIGYDDVPFENILTEYREYYHALNPQALFHMANPSALVYYDGCDPVYTPENYPDFTKWERDRIGIRHHLTGYCRPSDRLTYGFAFSGSTRTGPVSSRQLELFELAMQHIRRGVDLAYQLGTLQERLVRAEGLLDGSPALPQRALATLDGDGRPVLVNAAMEAIVRAGDGISLGRSGLALQFRSDHQRFMALVAAAIGCLDGRAGGSGNMAVARPSGKRPYVVRVSPIPRSEPRLAAPGAVVLVIVVDPDAEVEVPAALLSASFDLTPHEARVAAAMARGDTIDMIAERHGVAAETVRSQLKTVFAKTGTRRQAELVALLARLR